MNTLAQPESPKPNLGLLLAMGDQANSRVRKGLTYYAAGGAVLATAKTMWNRALAELTFTVTVDSGDDLYPEVHAWVMERVPARALRSLVARTERSFHAVPAGGRDQPPGVKLFYDGRRTQNVRLGAHRIRVSVEQEEIGANHGESSWGTPWKRDKVIFTAYGVPAREAVLEVLREMAARRHARHEVRLFGPGWGNWEQVAEMPMRTIDSVVLRPGQKEALVEDLGQFLADEPTYNRLGLPWHRGYLLTGPPGTGKTSLAKALAQHFHLDVYFCPLSAVPNDGALTRLFGSVPPRSLLLLEDIDIVHGARQRDDTEPGVSLSGLLNGLDGVTTPHGLVTVLTTNDETVLDPALVRAGRVDRTFALDYVSDTQLRNLVSFAMDGTMGTLPLPPLRGAKLSPAEAIEALKPHLGDPPAAHAALSAIVLSRSAALDAAARRAR